MPGLELHSGHRLVRCQRRLGATMRMVRTAAVLALLWSVSGLVLLPGPDCACADGLLGQRD